MDRIEKAARAMALADNRDPDQPLGRWTFKRIVSNTIPIERYDAQAPSWTYYVPLAKMFVAARDALNDG